MSARPVDAEHKELLRRYSSAVQGLALAVREFILREAPEANEFVYEVYTIADHFTFTDKPGDAFIFTTSHANWVNLGFHFGAMLPDPDGLLQGEGKFIRHIRIAEMTDLDTPGVRELLRAAIGEAERPSDKIGRPHTVVHRRQADKSRTTRRSPKGRKR